MAASSPPAGSAAERPAPAAASEASARGGAEGEGRGASPSSDGAGGWGDVAGLTPDAAETVAAAAAAAAAVPKESCIKHIDAIWFCYSPVYQTTQYYREGIFDSCLSKWGDLWDCMLLRTAAAPNVMARRQERQQQQGPEPPHIWQMRTPEQAREFWEQEFGHKKQP